MHSECAEKVKIRTLKDFVFLIICSCSFYGHLRIRKSSLIFQNFEKSSLNFQNFEKSSLNFENFEKKFVKFSKF